MSAGMDARLDQWRNENTHEGGWVIGGLVRTMPTDTLEAFTDAMVNARPYPEAQFVIRFDNETYTLSIGYVDPNDATRYVEVSHAITRESAVRWLRIAEACDVAFYPA